MTAERYHVTFEIDSRYSLSRLRELLVKQEGGAELTRAEQMEVEYLLPGIRYKLMDATINKQMILSAVPADEATLWHWRPIGDLTGIKTYKMYAIKADTFQANAYLSGFGEWQDDLGYHYHPTHYAELPQEAESK